MGSLALDGLIMLEILLYKILCRVFIIDNNVANFVSNISWCLKNEWRMCGLHKEIERMH